MADLELQQVRMKLTDDPAILDQLRKNRTFRIDPLRPKEGEFYGVTFDSVPLRFHKGEVKTLSKRIADAIYKNGWVIMGEHINGEYGAVFEVVEEINLSDLLVAKPKYACPECGKDLMNAQNLAYHLGQDHADEGEGLQDQVEDDEEEVK